MEPLRRDALIRAAIDEIADGAGRDVTVARIARRAGMSPALAHHYFGSKDRMLLAAMRRVLSDFGAEVRAGLARADTPLDRLEAIVRASFGPTNFRPEVVAAWLAFYVEAHGGDDARRLLHVYHGRLRSNLVHALRPLTPDPAPLAEGVAALIDGLYVRQALRRDRMTPDACLALVMGHVHDAIARGDVR
jgi:TetR/AcrR family transcriptional repressor of bet genes